MRLMLVCLLLILVTSVNGQNAFYDSDKGDIAAFNASVTDAVIADWLAFELQYDPVESAEWSALTPEARTKKVAEYRRAFEDNNLRLHTLRGLSAREFDELRQMMQMRAALKQSLRAARALMPTLGTKQHELIRDTCVQQIASFDKARRGYRNLTTTPQALNFLYPDLVRIDRDSCYVFLHKGFGKGVGFRVYQADGAWRLFRFDEYESWSQQEIALP